ncbi:MAG: lipopolysaccharide assembly protein LapB [Pseudomonadales bacterium]
MPDLSLFVLLLLALFIGWWVGRRKASKKEEDSGIDPAYYKGLYYLISQRPDQAIDSFVDNLEVNAETLDMHLAIGKMLRKRGELERAIKVHQNLLTRPNLTRQQRATAHLELARDYLKSGWFDRAEGLLLDAVNKHPALEKEALSFLLEIYEEERDWLNCILTGDKLLPRNLLGQRIKSHTELQMSMGHYCCEIAEAAIKTEDWSSARRYLKQAIGYDPGSLRAMLLEARLERLNGRNKQALGVLRQIPAEQFATSNEAMALLYDCYKALGDDKSLIDYLRKLVDVYPSDTLVLALAQQLEKQCSKEQAAEFVVEQVRKRPSLKGVLQVLRISAENSTGEVHTNLDFVQDLMGDWLDKKPNYRCKDCGFSVVNHIWHCPSCKRWSSMRQLKGIAGDQDIAR